MVEIKIEETFRYRFGTKDLWLMAGSYYYLDPNKPQDRQELDYMTSPSFPYAAYIRVGATVHVCDGQITLPTTTPYPTNTPFPTPSPNMDCPTIIPVRTVLPSQPISGCSALGALDNTFRIWNGTRWVTFIESTSGSGTGGNNTIIPMLRGDVYSNGITNEVSISPNIIVDADVSPNARIQLSKLERNPLDRINHIGVQAASTIVDFDIQVRTNTLNQLRTPTFDLSIGGNRLVDVADPTYITDGANKRYVDAKLTSLDYCDLIGPSCDLELNGYKITQLGTPIGPKDATTKEYIDDLIESLPIKPTARLVSVENLPSLSGTGMNIDNFVVGSGDNVLLVNQDDNRLNGLWRASPSLWQRVKEADEGNDLRNGMVVHVTQGSEYAGTGWMLITDGQSVTLGISPLEFHQVNILNAGNGLYKTHTTLHVGGKENEIAIYPDAIGISPFWPGQDSITTLGTITYGTWRARIIDIPYGGTGASTPAQARVNLNAASAGVNSDITALQGLLTPLSIFQGGTSGCTAAEARANLQVADCIGGVSSCITQLPNFVGPLTIVQGGTGATDANTARYNLSAAKSGANSDITSLTGLTTPLGIPFGGTGANTAPLARVNLGIVYTGSNLGNGAGVYSSALTDANGVNLRFRTILGSTGISATAGADTVNLAIVPSQIMLPDLGGILPIVKGGTGATTAPAALLNLGGISTVTSTAPWLTATKSGTGVTLTPNIVAGSGIIVTVVGNTLVISLA